MTTRIIEERGKASEEGNADESKINSNRSRGEIMTLHQDRDISKKKQIRLKCFYNEEIRIVRLKAGTVFEQLLERLNSDYGFEVALKYEDPEGDSITLSTQNDLNELLESEQKSVTVHVSNKSLLRGLNNDGPLDVSSTNRLHVDHTNDADQSFVDPPRSKSPRSPIASRLASGSPSSFFREDLVDTLSLHSMKQLESPRVDNFRRRSSKAGGPTERSDAESTTRHASKSMQHSIFGNHGKSVLRAKEERRENSRSDVVKNVDKTHQWKWQQGEVLGRGAFGTVYLGLNLRNGELMAVKQLNTEEVSQKELVTLEHEVEMMAGLTHPNIVRYLGTERTGNKFCIFLEYVPGGSIRNLLERFGSLEERIVRVYCRQLLLGLEYLHRHGIAHRDIKGANVLLSNDGTIKLADFGASKRMSNSTSVVGGLKGTPFFMAPEVIKEQQGERSWKKADVWSVGCTVIEMASGKPPWSQYSNPVTAMYQIACLNSIPELPSELSELGQKFLKICFKREANKRPDVTSLLLHPFVAFFEEPSEKSRVSARRLGSASLSFSKTRPRSARLPSLRITPSGETNRETTCYSPIQESTIKAPRRRRHDLKDDEDGNEVDVREVISSSKAVRSDGDEFVTRNDELYILPSDFASTGLEEFTAGTMMMNDAVEDENEIVDSLYVLDNDMIGAKHNGDLGVSDASAVITRLNRRGDTTTTTSVSKEKNFDRSRANTAEENDGAPKNDDSETFGSSALHEHVNDVSDVSRRKEDEESGSEMGHSSQDEREKGGFEFARSTSKHLQTKQNYHRGSKKFDLTTRSRTTRRLPKPHRVQSKIASLWKKNGRKDRIRGSFASTKKTGPGKIGREDLVNEEDIEDKTVDNIVAYNGEKHDVELSVSSDPDAVGDDRLSDRERKSIVETDREPHYSRSPKAAARRLRESINRNKMQRKKLNSLHHRRQQDNVDDERTLRRGRKSLASSRRRIGSPVHDSMLNKRAATAGTTTMFRTANWTREVQQMLENQKIRDRNRSMLFTDETSDDETNFDALDEMLPSFASRTMPLSPTRGGSRSERSVLIPHESDIFVRGRRARSAAAGKSTHLGRCSPRHKTTTLKSRRVLSKTTGRFGLRNSKAMSSSDAKNTAAKQIQNWLRSRISSLEAETSSRSMLRQENEDERDINLFGEVDPNAESANVTDTSRDKGGIHQSNARGEIVMSGHRGPVTCLHVDDRYESSTDVIASGSLDATVRLWDPKSGKQLRVLTHAAKSSSDPDKKDMSMTELGVTALRVCPHTHTLISGLKNGSIWTWDLETGKRKRKISAHDRPVQCICGIKEGARTSYEDISNGSDASRIVTSGDNLIHIWDFRARRPLVVTLRGHTDIVTAVALHSSSSTVLSGSRDQCIRAWDIRMRRAKFVGREHYGTIYCLQATQERDVEFISAGRDASLKVWDYSGKCLRTMRGHRGSVNSTALPGGCSARKTNRVVSGSSDANIRLWNVEDGGA